MSVCRSMFRWWWAVAVHGSFLLHSHCFEMVTNGLLFIFEIFLTAAQQTTHITAPDQGTILWFWWGAACALLYVDYEIICDTFFLTRAAMRRCFFIPSSSLVWHSVLTPELRHRWDIATTHRKYTGTQKISWGEWNRIGCTRVDMYLSF